MADYQEYRRRVLHRRWRRRFMAAGLLFLLVLLGAVMAVSYAFTTQGSCPAPEVRFGDEALEVNGYCWHAVFINLCH